MTHMNNSVVGVKEVLNILQQRNQDLQEEFKEFISHREEQIQRMTDEECRAFEQTQPKPQ